MSKTGKVMEIDILNLSKISSTKHALFLIRSLRCKKKHWPGFDSPVPDPDSPRSSWCSDRWLQGGDSNYDNLEMLFTITITFKIMMWRVLLTITITIILYQVLFTIATILLQVLNHKNQDIRPPAASSTGGEVSTEQVVTDQLIWQIFAFFSSFSLFHIFKIWWFFLQTSYFQVSASGCSSLSQSSPTCSSCQDRPTFLDIEPM